MKSETSLAELEREKGFGDHGVEVDREIPQINMSNFRQRKLEISDALWEAATGIGFFQLYNHGIPQALVDDAFTASEHFLRYQPT